MFERDEHLRGFKKNNRITYPNPEFLKQVFPLQDEQMRECEPHSENFELELKKFFSMGRRRTGRTSILARVMVETAIESGREITVYDHYLDSRAGREGAHHLLMRCRDVIEDYKRQGCNIEVVKFGQDKFQLFLHPEDFNAYNRLKIENNPSRVVRYKKEEFLNKKLLLLL